MKPKSLIVWGLAILALAFLCSVVGLYFFQFKDGNILSNSKADWGTFGDYLSGVFAMFNLGVVVILAIYVSNNDTRRSNRELEVQRKITLSQLRMREFEALNQLLSRYNRANLEETTVSQTYKVDLLKQMLDELWMFVSNENVLFAFEDYENFLENVNKLIVHIDSVHNKLQKGELKDFYFNLFEQSKRELKQSIYKFITDDLKG